MKRAWDFINSIFWWNKEQEREERRGHFLTYKEHTKLGKLVEDLFYSELVCYGFIKDDDRGIHSSSYVIFSFPQFVNQYKSDMHRKFEFEMRIALDKNRDKFTTRRHIATVFENEIMYYLMKEHGVSYEAVFNFIPFNAIPRDDCHNSTFLNETLQNIRKNLNFSPLSEILCNKVKHLYEIAVKICSYEGCNLEDIFH